MKSVLYSIARKYAGDRFPEILALGGDEGWAAFLGHRPGETEPAILLLQVQEDGREHPPQVLAHLDSTLPVGRTTCTACRAAQAGWPRYCGVCRADLAPVWDDPQADLVLPGGYEHLGALRRAEGGGPLHFLRKGPAGRVVGMVEKPAADGAVELLPVWTSTPVAAPRGRRWRTAGVGGAVVAAALLITAVALRDPRISAAKSAPDTRLVQRGETTAAPPPVRRTVEPPPEQPRSTAGGGAVPSPSPGAAGPAAAGAGATSRVSAPLPREGKDEPGATPSPAPARLATAPPAPTPQGVEAAIERYAAAVGSGETRRIARVYPGITAAEVDRWNRFFAPLGPGAGLRASYEVVSGPTLEGSRAEVIFTLTLSYMNATGAPARQSLPLRALLHWAGTGWSLEEVRLLQ